MSFDGASMAYEILQKPMKAVETSIEAKLASMSLDGASMAYEMLQNHCFYNAELVEARIEAGLNEPRWHMIFCKNLCFALQKLLKPVPRRATMNPDGASVAYEMLQKPLLLLCKNC